MKRAFGAEEAVCVSSMLPAPGPLLAGVKHVHEWNVSSLADPPRDLHKAVIKSSQISPWRLFLLKENGTGTFYCPQKFYGAENLCE